MSCRVFARQLETEAMNIAVERARSRGVRRFRGRCIPTPKNGVVKELYGSLGFTPVARQSAANCPMQWQLALDGYVPTATHVARQLTAR